MKTHEQRIGPKSSRTDGLLQGVALRELNRDKTPKPSDDAAFDAQSAEDEAIQETEEQRSVEKVAAANRE